MRRLFASLVAVGALIVAPVAHADDANANGPPRSSWHPQYAAALEAHASIFALDAFGVGFGGGVRAEVPVFENAPFSRADDTIGVAIGLEYARYNSYKPTQGSDVTIGTDAIYVPISIPFEFWLGRVVVSAEPILLYRFASYAGDCQGISGGCTSKSLVMPSGAIGLKVRVAEHVAIAFRASWPTVSLGATWL
jgi:hypothetical protein